MLFRQLFDHDSYTYTYLIASDSGGEGIIIDPVRNNVDHYIQLCEELDIKLTITLDTHVHADHITGSGLLHKRLGCDIVMGIESKASPLSQTVKDGDILTFGELSLKCLATPGHTDDSYSFLLDDRVFTGDALFIRGTGRTDFQNGDPKQLYDSLFKKLLRLPEETLVYPGHDYKGMTVSTIREEKRFNPHLQVGSLQAFTDLMNALDLPNPQCIDVAIPANLNCGLDAS